MPMSCSLSPQAWSAPILPISRCPRGSVSFHPRKPGTLSMPLSDAKSDLQQRRVSIRPGVGILSVLRHLNYKPWFAMAEFVDNSLQSFLQNREQLQKLHGKDYCLKVEIEIERSDETRIRIRDNAAGIASIDYARAFRPAELPNIRT